MRARKINLKGKIFPLKGDCSAGRKNQNLIFVVSGPSGAGKSTLLQHLLQDKNLRQRLTRSVSLTTRPPRSGEREGRDYFFISDRDFRRKNKAKKLLEWTRHLGYYYATPKDFIAKQLQRGRHVILCLDLKGASQIKQLYPQKTVTIFIEPPSLKDLKQRIKKRGSRPGQGEFKQRLELAQRELLAAQRYDYRLMNEDLTQATKALKALILKLINRRNK